MREIKKLLKRGVGEKFILYKRTYHHKHVSVFLMDMITSTR